MDADDKKDKIFQIIDSCNRILDKKTHVEVILSIRKELTNLFEFDGVNVFFQDKYSKGLITFLLF